jgi:PAS domain S-box-containing protein
MFFTNHLRVLTLVGRDPNIRLREIASQVGITERAAHRIIAELSDAGYLARNRAGTRNRYTILRFPPVEEDAADLLRRSIGDQPSAERALAAESDGLDAVFGAMPAGVVIADGTGKILRVNSAFCEIIGRAESELLGRTFREHTHPDDLAAEEERLALLASGARDEYAGDKRYIRADGTSAFVNVRIRRLTDPETRAPVLIAHVTENAADKRKQRELDEAEERFRTAFDNAPIGMALVAPDGRWLKVNRAICEITGYSETALLTRTFQSITHPDDLDADLELLRQVLAGERRTYQMDKRYLHADGHIIWVSLSVSLVRDASGEPLYLITQVKDITGRRAAEESIRRVVDRIAEAVSVIDVDGTHLHTNTASRAILDDLRVSFDGEAIGDLEWGAIAEDGTPLRPEQLPAEITRRTGEEINDAVVGFPSKSAEVRWLRISTRRLSDGPAPYQVIVSYMDISRRKQAERSLALSEARLNALFRYIPAALSLRDLDGCYLHVTDSVARALGCTPEDAVGRHPSEHLSGELLTQTLADDVAIRAGSGPISREVRTKHADGTEHDYYVLKWPVHDEHGAVAALGAFSLDITERKQSEERIRELLEPA